jgi:putative nucleotidyltransferase with HDIG domain
VRVTWPLRALLQAPTASGGAGGAAREAVVEAGTSGTPGGEGAPAWAAALGVAPAVLQAEPAEPDEEERAAAALVRFHFLADLPEPAALPRVALQLLDLLLDEELEVAELCRLVELDAALSGAVLARANAAAGRALDPIETVPHAVTRLGLSEVARVAAATALRGLYDGRAGAAFGAFVPLWPLLFQHAVASGRLASELARGQGDLDPDVAYMAGLLHDVGLASGLRSLAALTQDGSLPRREPASALRVLLQVHLEVGEESARAWRLPARLAEALSGHHAADLAAEPALVRVVALASALDLWGAMPAAAPGAPRQAVAAARALGGTPAWLAAAVARRGEAVAWARRCFALV